MQIQVNEVGIDKVHEEKFLGVIIDVKINWKSHVKHGHNNISRSIAVLSKMEQILDHESLYSTLFTLHWFHHI